MKGKVKFYKDYNGYGFLMGEDNKEYFIHVSQIRALDFRTLNEGQTVEFTPDI